MALLQAGCSMAMDPTSLRLQFGTGAEAALSREERRELGQARRACLQGSGQHVRLEHEPLLKSVPSVGAGSPPKGRFGPDHAHSSE